ncbi:MAG: flavin reductase family protein [Oceanospirillaceae bacterium]
MSFDIRELRNAFGSFMTGVTVVTAVSETGEKVGFTANSFTSVSVDPALLLICPAKNLSSFDIFNNCKHFAVNILAEDQQEVSNTFAGGKGDRFADIAWHSNEQGVPLIDGAVAHFSCTTYNNVDAGDHIVLIGQVNVFNTNDKLGLGYAKSGYFSLGMEHRAEELSQKQAGIVGAVIEYQDKVLLTKTDAGYSLPQVQSKVGQGSLEAARQYLSSKGLDAELGSVFSIYENLQDKRFSTYYHAQAATDNTAQLGEFISVSELANLEFVTNDIKSMMQRYAMEKNNGVFRMYVGDNQSGDIH